MNPIILFDGMCNLCTGSVQFVIKRDKKKIFRFASLQSDIGQQLTAGVQTAAVMDTFMLYKNGKLYTRSTAALLVAKELSGVWPALSLLMVVPPVLRDSAYNMVAKNRYRWFGKKNECWLPTPDLKERFEVTGIKK